MNSLLQLNFIPAQYWNTSLSNFKLIDKGKPLPKDANFFILWSTSDSSEVELIDKINYIFPNVPVDRLRTCKINLAFPLDDHFFQIQDTIGKIMPIPPGINLLYQLQILESNNRSLTFYSNSIKTYAFLTKL
ncbi:MAG: hypothetical protein EU535_04705, partial [Promethearchaeota archaeon]